MVRMPRGPDGLGPLSNPAKVIFGISRIANVSDSELSSLLRRRLRRPLELGRTTEPLLDGLIRFDGRGALERRVHPRQVRRVGLRRSHVLGRMLQGIGVHGQSMESSVSIVAELTLQDFVEQLLTRSAPARCSAFRTRRGGAESRLRGLLSHDGSLQPAPKFVHLERDTLQREISAAVRIAPRQDRRGRHYGGRPELPVVEFLQHSSGCWRPSLGQR
jgi:hypothetical protein